MQRLFGALLVFMLASGVAFGQELSAVQSSAGGGWKAITTDGTVVFVPSDPANRHCQAVRAWIAAGKPVSPEPAPTAAEIRNDRIERIVNLHIRILALQRELSQDQTHAAAINNMIDAAQARIEFIRTH